MHRVKVIDLSRALAGPYCTMLLADLGAGVVKVESPQGDHVRYVGPFAPEDELRAFGGYFQSVNRNKRSIVVDLKIADGVALLRRLIADADVVVENFRPGVMDRLGLGYESLAKDNPKLVYGSLSGFGSPRAGESPYAAWPSYDIVAQAMGGLMGVTGPDGTPTKTGPGVGDIFPAALLAVGILGAVVNVRSGGDGQFVDVAMYDAVLSLCERIVYQHSYADIVSKSTGSDHPFFAPFGVFRAADGNVAIAAHHDRAWNLFAQIMGRPELADDPELGSSAARSRNRLPVKAVVEEWTSQRPVADIVAELGGRVPVAPVNSVVDILADPHVAARDLLLELEHPGLPDPRTVVGTAIKLGSPRTAYERAPLLGEHTVEVLRESGIDEAEIAALLESKAVSRG
ncbi:CaiB/BaiF CoA transferase family protein [Micromonospora sp. NPDC005161]